MKTNLHPISRAIVLIASVLFSVSAIAQIDYQQDFSQVDHHWTDLDFKVTDVAVCETPTALRANVNATQHNVVETVSPAIGISNGEELVLTYRYKLLKYDNVLPYQPENIADWGSITLDYGPSRNGPWTQVDAIIPQNHVVSADCAVRQVVFTPADSSKVYLRVRAGGGINPRSNYYVYIDDISAVQDGLSIDPIFAQGGVQVYPNPVQDYLNVRFNGTISNIVIFDNQGREVVVEDINKDLSRLDLTGLAHGDYVLKVTANNEIKEINVTKK